MGNDVKTFFETKVPALLKQNAAAYRAGGGALCFVIHGAGEWTIRFGRPRVEDAVEAGPNFEADTTLMMTELAFHELLRGKLPAKGWVIDGDSKLLEVFGRLLGGPARGVVGIRCAAL